MTTKSIWLALLLAFVATRTLAQKPLIYSTNGVAINGYDPVAYFTESKPVLGDSTITYRYLDATWRFATAANRDAFAADPARYAPQYGGYCAFGLSRGYKAHTLPEAWTIDHGKLYLNYNLKVRESWNKDRPAFIQKADTNWPTVSKQ
jgi:hypothetical protein